MLYYDNSNQVWIVLLLIILSCEVEYLIVYAKRQVYQPKSPEIQTLSDAIDILEAPRYHYVPGVLDLLHAFYNSCYGEKLPVRKHANESSRFPFIVISGFHGSGKDQVIQAVRSKLQWIYLPSPPYCMFHLRPAFLRQTALLRHAYWILSYYVTANFASQFTQVNGVIAEWYWHVWLTQYLANEVHATRRRLDIDMRDTIEIPKFPQDLLKPDLTVHLHVTSKTFLRRKKLSGLVFNKESFNTGSLSHIFRRIPDPDLVHVSSDNTPNLVSASIIAELIKRKLIVEDDVELSHVTENEDFY